MIKKLILLCSLGCTLNSYPVQPVFDRDDIISKPGWGGAPSPSSYDEFDSIADEMDRRGIEREKPQEVSAFQAFMRRIGCALLLRYLALKTRIKTWWNLAFTKKRA